MASACELCTAAHITPWYYEDDVCWIAECEICEVPMVVWREHGVHPRSDALQHMHNMLRQVATEHFGAIYVDDHMRNVPDHYHAHGAPRAASAVATSPADGAHRAGRGYAPAVRRNEASMKASVWASRRL